MDACPQVLVQVQEVQPICSEALSTYCLQMLWPRISAVCLQLSPEVSTSHSSNSLLQEGNGACLHPHLYPVWNKNLAPQAVPRERDSGRRMQVH